MLTEPGQAQVVAPGAAGRIEAHPACEQLSVTEIDHKLARAVKEHERSENLICFYLGELDRRKGYRDFGFANVHDYALERFGFSPRKTRYFLYLSRRLRELPRLTEALVRGHIGWCKVAKVAAVATPEDEASWLEKAKALSVRELEHRIRDGESYSGRGQIKLWLTEEQASVWHRALETCRRLCGEAIEPSSCLELIAGEFLATYESLVAREAEDTTDEAEEPTEATISLNEEQQCPEGSELPVPVAKPYSETHRAVLERDRYRCQYPGCSAMSGLQIHHIEYRSRSGTKGKEASNSSPNLVALCFVHHRMIHAALIGVKGRAPVDLEWRRPALMETIALRIETKERFDQMLESVEEDEFEGIDASYEPLDCPAFRT